MIVTVLIHLVLLPIYTVTLISVHCVTLSVQLSVLYIGNSTQCTKGRLTVRALLKGSGARRGTQMAGRVSAGGWGVYRMIPYVCVSPYSSRNLASSSPSHHLSAAARRDTNTGHRSVIAAMLPRSPFLSCLYLMYLCSQRRKRKYGVPTMCIIFIYILLKVTLKNYLQTDGKNSQTAGL